MIAGIVGRLLRVAAALRAGPAADGLRHVGEELLRLEQRRAQEAASAR